jgi:hypothetical protein
MYNCPWDVIVDVASHRDVSEELDIRSHVYDRRDFELADESIRLVLSHLK